MAKVGIMHSGSPETGQKEIDRGRWGRARSNFFSMAEMSHSALF